jgi:hypothetical protein
MTNKLIPTPIVDKNGKQTTVHKKASSAAASSSTLARVAPAPPAAEKVIGTPLPVVHPLSAGEVEEFIASYSNGRIRRGGKLVDTAAVFKSLSGITQGLLWRVRQAGAIADQDIEMSLDQLQSRVWHRWSATRNPEKVAEENFRAYLLVAERLHRTYPELMKSIGYGTATDLSKVVEYRDHKQGRTLLSAKEMTTEEEVTPIAAVAAYALVCMYRNSDFYDTDHLVMREYQDEEGRYIEGLMIANKALDTYVRENPEMAVRLAEFVVDRGLGDSNKDAKFAIEHFSLDAPALSSGHL